MKGFTATSVLQHGETLIKCQRFRKMSGNFDSTVTGSTEGPFLNMKHYLHFLHAMHKANSEKI